MWTFLVVLLIGCSGEDSESAADADADSDSDADADADSDADADADADADSDSDADSDADSDSDSDADTDADTDADADTDTDADADLDPDTCEIFPADNPWNTDVSDHDVLANSDDIIDSIGRDTGMHSDFGTVWAGAPNGIPYLGIPGDTPTVDVTFVYWDESDPGPYPIPDDVPIEGGPDSDGDRHVIVIDVDDCMLYELFAAYPIDGGATWDAISGAIFDLGSNDLRPDGWTSADAAGLPIFPGLVRYDEVIEEGVIDHALRFTVEVSRRAYVHPATHWASDDTSVDLPAMGMRFRMKPGYDCSGLSAEIQVICTALKTYGMLLADNGTDWYVSGAPNPLWDDGNLADIASITGDAFEVLDTGAIIE